MLSIQKIPLYRVRQAYNLTPYQVDALVQALCPHALFPLELWKQTYTRFWHDAARAASVQNKSPEPTLPDCTLTAGSRFHANLCGMDVATFFRELSLCIATSTLRIGLDYLLSEAFDAPDAVFAQEKDGLFQTLAQLEQRGADFDMFTSENLDAPLLALPVSSYHFIAQLFPDTMLVDVASAIYLLRDYPLVQEVKGITHTHAEMVRQSPPSLIDDTPPMPTAITEDTSLDADKPRICVPAALWEGKSEPAVRDAMTAEGYSPAAIAYVLFHWCRTQGHEQERADYKTPMGRKTHIGRLLAKKTYRDDKSYRNMMDTLLQEAALYSIVKE